MISFHSHAFAEIVSSKGMAAITYSGRKPDSSKILEAQSKAKMNAIERYIAIKDSESMTRNFEQIRTEVEANVDAYLLGTVVVSEETNKDSKRYSVVVRIDINEAKLKNALQDSSAVGNAANHEKSEITFVFVAREQTRAKSYDDIIRKGLDSSASEDGAEFEAASGGGVEYASESNRSETVTTGGSTERISDKIDYDVSTSGEIDAAMTRIFSTSGFAVVAAEYIEEETGMLLDVSAFKEDFGLGGDISSSTKRNALKGVKNAEIPFLGWGTLDLDMRETDPVSGLVRVNVKVTAKIVNVAGRRPRNVASVGPVMYSGIGRTETSARSNALKLAAEAAAKELVEQLNAKGVQ
jgi:hypothetical protein